MSDTLEEKVRYILDDSDFNDLPFEERVRISRYKAEQQILTLYQVLNKDKSNTTEAWRKKTRAWLKNCVDIYYREYRYPQVEQTEPIMSQEDWEDEYTTQDRTDCAWK